MVEVTDADRQAAVKIFAMIFGNGHSATHALTNTGRHFMFDELARHRIAAEQRAEQRGKLEGARLAIEAAKTKIRQFDPEHYSVQNDDGDMICSIIADDLATLDPDKIVGEG